MQAMRCQDIGAGAREERVPLPDARLSSQMRFVCGRLRITAKAGETVRAALSRAGLRVVSCDGSLDRAGLPRINARVFARDREGRLYAAQRVKVSRSNVRILEWQGAT